MSQLFTKKSKTHFGITFLHFGQHTFYHLCTKKRCMFLFFWFSKFLCKLRLFRDHSWVDNCNFHDFWKFIISVFENENWLVGGVLERIFTWRMHRYHYFFHTTRRLEMVWLWMFAFCRNLAHELLRMKILWHMKIICRGKLQPRHMAYQKETLFCQLDCCSFELECEKQ